MGVTKKSILSPFSSFGKEENGDSLDNAKVTCET